MRNTRDDGYTLVELAVVLAIIGTLTGILIPTLQGFKSRANDVRATAGISQTATAEMGVFVTEERFTEETAVLKGLVPTLDLGSEETSVHVVVGDIVAGDGAQVLLYARSRSGTWFGSRLVMAGSAQGHFTCSGDTEADMTLAGCTGTEG